MSFSLHTWIFVVGLVYSQNSGCDNGWFGSSCQYKCRCVTKCQSYGLCEPVSGCQLGWFGPACQYADMAAKAPVVLRPEGKQTSIITDGNDTTCNTETTSESLTLTWGPSYLITWMRVNASSFGRLQNLTVQFSDNKGATYLKNVNCVKSDAINSPVMDIFCDLNVPVNHVVLTGEAVQSLCSLYISLGRNVALRQQTSQSTTYQDDYYYGSDKAVDGVNSIFFWEHKCASTNGSFGPIWFITLSRPVTLYRYIIYTRYPNSERLQGFELRTFDVKNTLVYNYTDRSETSHVMYELYPKSPTMFVSHASIQLNRSEFMPLCEVEIYGDTECVNGRYGLECEHTCNCANKSEPCFVSTGACPSGCALGYHGEACTQRCDDGWFGSTCQYKCRCTVSYEMDGSCKAGSECQKGWFGPACQYVDLAYSVPVTTDPGDNKRHDITDNNDQTCNTDILSQSLTLTLSQSYLITWLRVYTNPAASLTVQFSPDNGTSFLNVTCVKIVTSDSPSIDIVCDLNVPVNQVSLTGDAVKSVCSLYISGGRNVALRQQTSQSMTYVENSTFYGSEKAVDGNTNRDFYQRSCTATTDSSVPYWSIYIPRPVTIYRYVLYNTDNNPERLQGFILIGFDVNDVQVYNYIDTSGDNQTLYTIVPGEPTVSLSRVHIQLPRQEYLMLCETEIYGETECVDGRYGRDCEHTCNCANTSESCFVSTGGCMSGCAPGYHGESCIQRCPPGKYGSGCIFSCSQFCAPDSSNKAHCHHTNGACLNGCLPGYKGANCDTRDAISTPGTSPLVTTPHPSSSSVRTESTEVVPPTPSFFRHDFECHQTFMRVYIQNSLVPNAELTMKDPGCRLQDNGTHYVISFLYDMCGTSLTSYTDHVNVQNQITVHTILSNVSGVEFVPDYIIPLQCSVNRTRSIHSAFQVVTRDPMDEHDRMASDFDIKEYRSELYQDEITEYPVLIPFNREIFFDLVLSNNQTNSGISVTKCEATPSSNPNDATRLTLITNGCSASPAVKVQGRYRIDHFRFSVQAFHFSGSINQNNTVYVHCNVSICQPGTCTTVCSRNIRRRRSSRHDVTLTSGTHIVASEVN